MMSTNWAILTNHVGSSELARIFRQPAFLNTIRLLVDIEAEPFEQALAQLRTVEGFLGSARLLELLTNKFNDSDHADALASALLNFTSLRARSEPGLDFGQEVERLVEELAVPQLGDRGKVGLARIKAALEPIPGLEMAVKAEDVAGRVGSSLHELRFVTDLRPVFDETHDAVLGCIPMTTLKLVVDGPEVLPRTIEVNLTEKQLMSLCTQGAEARKKVAVLKRTLVEKSLPLPDTSWTEQSSQ